MQHLLSFSTSLNRSVHALQTCAWCFPAQACPIPTQRSGSAHTTQSSTSTAIVPIRRLCGVCLSFRAPPLLWIGERQGERGRREGETRHTLHTSLDTPPRRTPPGPVVGGGILHHTFVHSHVRRNTTMEQKRESKLTKPCTDPGRKEGKRIEGGLSTVHRHPARHMNHIDARKRGIQGKGSGHHRRHIAYKAIQEKARA